MLLWLLSLVNLYSLEQKLPAAFVFPLMDDLYILNSLPQCLHIRFTKICFLLQSREQYLLLSDASIDFPQPMHFFLGAVLKPLFPRPPLALAQRLQYLAPASFLTVTSIPQSSQNISFMPFLLQDGGRSSAMMQGTFFRPSCSAAMMRV